MRLHISRGACVDRRRGRVPVYLQVLMVDSCQIWKLGVTRTLQSVPFLERRGVEPGCSTAQHPKKVGMLPLPPLLLLLRWRLLLSGSSALTLLLLRAVTLWTRTHVFRCNTATATTTRANSTHVGDIQQSHTECYEYVLTTNTNADLTVSGLTNVR